MADGTANGTIPPPGTSIHRSGEFRKFLPDLNTPRFEALKVATAQDHVNAFLEKHNPPWLFQLWEHWRRLYQEPFRGVTTDGNVRLNLFTLQDEGVPITSINSAAKHYQSLLTPSQLTASTYHIDAPEWRTWSNPEFYLSQKGVRLDEATEPVRAAALALLEATLSPEGYQKALGAMRVNHFLGELCNCAKVMNEYSYNVVFFGEPDETAPWGFSFYGHHLCLNIFLVGSQIVISPWFTGAEPNEIDKGPHAGTRILQAEEELGLRLMQSLPEDVQKKVQIYELMHDPKMPPGRWNKDDQRHFCGAYRDNRIVPYEGCVVSSFTAPQQQLVWEILNQYLLYLPTQAREAKIAHCKHFADETYFCWIGGYGVEDPFYFRVQSPVIVVEFDHHSGVFLGNGEPAKFHIHTLLRTPNGGDYGMALRPLIGAKEGAFIWDA